MENSNAIKENKCLVELRNVISLYWPGRASIWSGTSMFSLGYINKYVSSESYSRCRITGNSINWNDETVIPDIIIQKFTNYSKKWVSTGDNTHFRIGLGTWNGGYI